MTVPAEVELIPSETIMSVSAGGSAPTKRLYWNEALAGTIEPCDVSTADWESFSASMRSRPLGTGCLTVIHSDPCQVSTTADRLGARRSGRIGVQLCLSGEFEFDHEGETARVAQGQAAVVDSMRMHRVRIDAPVRLLCLSLDRSDLGGVLRAVEAPVVLCRTDPVASVTLDFIKNSWTALTQLEAKRRPLLQARLGQLLAACLSQHDARVDPCSSHVQSMVYRAKQIVLQRIGDAAFGPPTLAEAMGVTRRYLTTLFQSIDDTPADYIRRIRLHAAWDLLSDVRCTLAISDIAEQVGFKDPVQFSKAIRHHFSATPRDIRLDALG